MNIKKRVIIIFTTLFFSFSFMCPTRKVYAEPVQVNDGYKLIIPLVGLFVYSAYKNTEKGVAAVSNLRQSVEYKSQRFYNSMSDGLRAKWKSIFDKGEKITKEQYDDLGITSLINDCGNGYLEGNTFDDSVNSGSVTWLKTAEGLSIIRDIAQKHNYTVNAFLEASFNNGFLNAYQFFDSRGKCDQTWFIKTTADTKMYYSSSVFSCIGYSKCYDSDYSIWGSPTITWNDNKFNIQGSYYDTIDFYDAVTPDQVRTMSKVYLSGTYIYQPKLDVPQSIDTAKVKSLDVSTSSKADFDSYIASQGTFQKEISSTVGALDNKITSTFDTVTETVADTNAETKTQTGILQGIKDIVFGIPSAIGAIPGQIAKVFDFSLPNTATLDFSPFSVAIADKFPFCIPFDLINLFRSFTAERRAPHWSLNFPSVLGMQPVSIDIDMDKAEFNKLATIFRYFILICFVYGLIMRTRNLIKG